MIQLPTVSKTLVLNIVGPLILAAIVSGSLWGIYTKIKSIGYKEAEIACTKRFEVYQATVDKRVKDLEGSVKGFDETFKELSLSLSSDMNKILIASKKQPTVIIKDGKCVPAPQFVDSLNEAILRANQK